MSLIKRLLVLLCCRPGQVLLCLNRHSRLGSNHNAIQWPCCRALEQCVLCEVILEGSY